jgi:hypothetical protein
MRSWPLRDLQFGHLERLHFGVIYAPKIAATLIPGFQPWDSKAGRHTYCKQQPSRLARVASRREKVRRDALRLEFGHFQSVARSGQESLAQGLPWVSQNKRFALKGLEICTQSASEVRSRSPVPDVADAGVENIPG